MNEGRKSPFLLRAGRLTRLIKTSPFAVVDGVSEAGGVHDGQLQLHALLLDVHRVLRDLHRLTDSLCGSETQSRSAAFNRVSGCLD